MSKQVRHVVVRDPWSVRMLEAYVGGILTHYALRVTHPIPVS
jgi:hypothetical protein